MNILFYGNCQVGGVRDVLNLDHNKYKTKLFLCFVDFNENEFNNAIKNADVIITQPISDNYREKSYLSTKYILEKKNCNCKIILFDSCYFNFYYFDMTYKIIDNEILNTPSDYHYNGIIEYYKNNFSQDKCIDNVINNTEFKQKEELEILAADSINELLRRNEQMHFLYNKRENVYFIHTNEYIKENYKKNLLFYSMNHPTKYLFQYICKKISDILNINETINYNCDPLSGHKGAPRGILYKCIQKCVDFDIEICSPELDGKNTIEDIVDIYYKSYKNKNIFFS